MVKWEGNVSKSEMEKEYWMSEERRLSLSQCLIFFSWDLWTGDG